MALVLKLDEETKSPVITSDGKIVYYDDEEDNPKDLPLDPPAMYAKIGELGKQNKIDRDKYTELRDKFALFKDVEDVQTWKEKADAALLTVENFNDKDWMKVEKVEGLKADMRESYEKKLLAKDEVLSDALNKHSEELNRKKSQIRKLMVSSQFATSPFFVGEKRKTNLPPHAGEKIFGEYFKVEEVDGSDELVLRAYDAKGEVIISQLNPGEPAEFNEAVGLIIDKYPYKDEILVASGGGSGGQGGGKGGGGDVDTLADLKKRHKEALASGQMQTAVALKNQIFELEHAS